MKILLTLLLLLTIAEGKPRQKVLRNECRTIKVVQKLVTLRCTDGSTLDIPDEQWPLPWERDFRVGRVFKFRWEGARLIAIPDNPLQTPKHVNGPCLMRSHRDGEESPLRMNCILTP